MLTKRTQMAMPTIDTTHIQEAAALLKAGKLVAFPTETVYGLGADARNPQAIANIFLAKQRPYTHPLIVHIAQPNQLTDWARDVPAAALTLAKAFWPGPLTLILKKQPHVSDLLTGNQDTIGLRIPKHPVATALLQAFGGAIAAPSANRFTHLSPTSADAVRDELGDKVDLILEGGYCEVGIESTILDMSRDQPTILRPGMISAAQIEAVLKKAVSSALQNAPRAPGMHHLHYAPDTQVVLVDSVATFLPTLTNDDLPLAFLVRKHVEFQGSEVNWIVMSDEPSQYAHDLYLTLRQLDGQGFKKIAVLCVPDSREWDAIRDRLGKAQSKEG